MKGTPRGESMNFPNVYTPAMLADRWACSERHVRNMIGSGELPAFRLAGKLLRIRREDVERFECQGQNSSGASPNTEESSLLPGTRATSADVIALGQAIRQRRPAAPRLDTRSSRGLKEPSSPTSGQPTA
ncbi:MAG: helix-turn-helix domain-containing protein [Mesorhizobium sp.]|nr:MAG: helix-turn-helix domain-containing protein [Mesorhizobium sp.]